MNGHIFRINLFEYSFYYYKTIDKFGQELLGGREYEALQALRKIMNFTPYIEKNPDNMVNTTCKIKWFV